MNTVTGLIICELALVLIPTSAAADTVLLKNGKTHELIVEKETPTDIWIRVRKSRARVPLDTIEKIEYATPEQNEQIKLNW